MTFDLIDTHAHLDFPEFDSDRDMVVKRAQEMGITAIVNVGASIERSQKSLDVAGRFGCVYATVGIHPHEADTFKADQIGQLRAMARQNKVVGIGEIGLDYYRNYSRQDNQRRLFEAQAALGKELDLPLVIHTRQAGDDTIAVLKEALPLRAVVHCFSGDKKLLDQCLDLGFFISYTCNITYRRAQDLRDMVAMTPLDRLMLETDSPFLPPEGMRGRRNDPSCVVKLAEEVAKLKNVSVGEIADATTRNARYFFGLLT